MLFNVDRVARNCRYLDLGEVIVEPKGLVSSLLQLDHELSGADVSPVRVENVISVPGGAFSVQFIVFQIVPRFPESKAIE